MCGLLFFLIKWGTLVYGLMVLLRKHLSKRWGKVDTTKEVSAEGKIVIVTGSNSGIGKGAALGFAERGATVIMACRSEERVKEAQKWIRARTWRGELVFMKLDLSSLESVREFAKEFKSKYDKLDILVNNAGVVVPVDQKRKTKEGFEIHMGVNHLGHFLLTNLLLEPLKQAENSRVVIVASSTYSWAPFDVDDLFSERKVVANPPLGLGAQDLYSRSKMANFLFNHELAKRLKGTGVNTYALCPGVVGSDLAQNHEGLTFELLKPLLFIMKFFMKTIEEGAATILHCALNKDLANESGEMYIHVKFWDPSKRALPEKDAEKLWDVSAKLVGL